MSSIYIRKDPTIPHQTITRCVGFVTRGALSNECAHLPDTCDVCSSRMSPLPHAHTSGKYVVWHDVVIYSKAHENRTLWNKHWGHPTMRVLGGRDGSPAEHWVYSHPSVRSFVILYTSPSFVWGREGTPTLEEFDANLSLAMAPRFAFPIYNTTGSCFGAISNFPRRIDEYRSLYGIEPDDTWWGWEFYKPIRT